MLLNFHFWYIGNYVTLLLVMRNLWIILGTAGLRWHEIHLSHLVTRNTRLTHPDSKIHVYWSTILRRVYLNKCLRDAAARSFPVENRQKAWLSSLSCLAWHIRVQPQIFLGSSSFKRVDDSVCPWTTILLNHFDFYKILAMCFSTSFGQQKHDLQSADEDIL